MIKLIFRLPLQSSLQVDGYYAGLSQPMKFFASINNKSICFSSTLPPLALTHLQYQLSFTFLCLRWRDIIYLDFLLQKGDNRKGGTMSGIVPYQFYSP
jgi:hypothetical protein